jgi:polysaccharide biosynthesis protein PslG
MSTGPLVGISLLLSGIAGGPARAANDAGIPGGYVLDVQGGARPLIASPAKPVGYDAQVPSQADPSSYVGLIEKGGANSLRDDVSWAYIEPTQGTFDWADPDEIVTEAAEHHLHPLLIVDTSPLWASGGSTANPDWFWLPPRSAAAYGAFAAAVAARYGPGGAFWQDHPTLPVYLPAGLELWNEENLSSSWGGEAPDPGLYTAMAKAAYPLIKQADPTMTVVLGGLSPAGGYDDVTCSGQTGTGHDASAWNGVNYLQALYGDGIHGYFDAVGWHAYNFNTGESAAQMLAYQPCSAWSQMSATPVSARSLMTAYGDAAKKVWITEAGAPTCTPGLTYNPCVSVAQQAALATAEAKWRTLSWAGGYYWYDIRDKTTDPQEAASHFGAVYANNSPKPAYEALLKAWGAAPKQQGPLTLTVPASRGVRSVAFSPDGKFIAAGDGNGHVYIWQDSTLRLASSLADPGSKGVSSVTFNPASSLIAAGDANGHVYLWADGKVHAALKVPSGKAVLSVAFSPDGKYLAAGDAAGHVYAWLVSTLHLAGTMIDPGGKGASSVAFNPANSLLASGDASGHTYLWDHRLAATLADPSSRGVTSVTFSSDSEFLAAGDANGKAYIWLVSKGDIVQSLADPAGKAINSVAFNPGATLLAAGDAHGHIYLWTPAPKLAGNLTDPRSGGVRSVTFSPNGQYLAAADANGHVYLWPVALDASLA